MSPVSPFLAPERDSSFKKGRAKRSGVTYYSIPGVYLTEVLEVAAVQDFDRYAPCFVDAPIVVDQLAFEVTVSAAINGRIGLYRSDADWQPIGAPLADSGDISLNTTGVKTYAPSTPLFLSRGRYLTVTNVSAGGVSVRAYGGSPPGPMLRTALGSSSFNTYCLIARTYAAFPTPGTAWTQDLSTPTPGPYQIVVLRVSTP